MYDFIFHNPTKIIFGRDTENQLGSELKRHGISKVLFVYGRDSIKRSGLYSRVTENLQAQAINFVEHPGVSSNPILSHTEEGVRLALEEKVAAVVAVGGGSVIDAAKGIAVGAKNAGNLWEFYLGKEIKNALPVFTILTIAATGSEMNGNSVLTNEATEQKYNISSPFAYPKVSILNPALTCTVPPDYSAFSAVDAIAHVIEGYFTGSGAGLQNRLVESIIKTVFATTDIILKRPDNYEARAEFMWAATLALNGLTPAGIGEYSFPNHMIEHSLSALYKIPHGAGLSIVIPAWMKWFKSRNTAKFARFAREIFSLNTADEGITALEEWFASINAPVRLSDAAISSDDLEIIAENAFGLASRWGIEKLYTKNNILEILRFAC